MRAHIIFDIIKDVVFSIITVCYGILSAVVAFEAYTTGSGGAFVHIYYPIALVICALGLRASVKDIRWSTFRLRRL